MDEQLIDRIYESSLVPELWPAVLEDLSRLSEAIGGSLFITRADVLTWTASPAVRDRAAQIVKEGLYWRGQFVTRALNARYPGFMTDLDLFTPEEIDEEPIYRDFWRPLGIGFAVGTCIPLPTDESVNILMSRLATRGPIERAIVQRLDQLRPHLARSVLLSARLQLERAQAASATLAALGLPALVLGEQGKVLAANRLIEGLTSLLQWRAHDRVALQDKAADQLLREAIASINENEEGDHPRVRSFPVRDTGTDAKRVAHVIPVRLSARDIFVHCSAVLVLTPVSLPQAPPIELVQSLFDLTPAEARVARNLAAGKTVEDMASDGGLSPNTIRSQVRGVLTKTGCSRQAEVIALLTGLAGPPLSRAF
ncbi:MAG TPA: helix-turn-helix transcriptional regulator [Methylocella sp.]|nr:helix-turn-helix transcriptional regulator [Methylocella sp.]